MRKTILTAMFCALAMSTMTVASAQQTFKMQVQPRQEGGTVTPRMTERPRDPIPETVVFPETPQSSLLAEPTDPAPRALVVDPAVDPGFTPPAPRLGFEGQIIHDFGMRILSTNWNSPAQRAGLERGDIIMRINGRQIHCLHDYQDALRDAARYSNGRLRLYVKNIRGGYGYGMPPMYVSVTAWLEGYEPRVVPVPGHTCPHDYPGIVAADTTPAVIY